MPEYKEITGKVQVPAGAGLEGFVRTIKEILRKPRVQNISIEHTGIVSFRRYVLPEEEERFVVDFEDMMPAAVVRNSEIVELPLLDNVSAATVLAVMFDVVTADGLKPIAFVGGAQCSFHNWFLDTTGVSIQCEDSVCGLPLHRDKQIPDSVLLLCASYTREAPLSDTKKTYKVEMSIPLAPMDNGVQI